MGALSRRQMYLYTGPPILYLLTILAFTSNIFHFLLYLLTLPAFKSDVSLFLPNLVLPYKP